MPQKQNLADLGLLRSHADLDRPSVKQFHHEGGLRFIVDLHRKILLVHIHNTAALPIVSLGDGRVVADVLLGFFIRFFEGQGMLIMDNDVTALLRQHSNRDHDEN